MQKLAAVTKNLTKTLGDHSPVILSATAVAGVLTTAVLTGKAAVEAERILALQKPLPDAEDYVSDEELLEVDLLTNQDKLKLVWKCYIPPALAGASTIAAIIGANQIASRRNAALLSVYSLTDTAFKEYKDKVVEQLGAKKDQAVRDAVAQDRVTANPVESREVIFTGNGDVLCLETSSGRYFQSNVEAIRKAENDINKQILNDMYASQNEFNDKLGLPATGFADTVGWNLDNMLEVQFSSALTEKNEPCLAIGYSKLPVPNYHKVY